MAVHGKCDPKLAKVKEELERNLAERGEVGASVCLSVNGQTAVDLWGGMANPETNDPWQEDTISIVFSCTKAAVALCAVMAGCAKNAPEQLAKAPPPPNIAARRSSIASVPS